MFLCETNSYFFLVKFLSRIIIASHNSNASLVGCLNGPEGNINLFLVP